VVKDDAGKVLYDTDDCFDQANACNKLDAWLRDQIAA
jgi:hypothetical protein